MGRSKFIRKQELLDCKWFFKMKRKKEKKGYNQEKRNDCRHNDQTVIRSRKLHILSKFKLNIEEFDLEGVL